MALVMDGTQFTPFSNFKNQIELSKKMKIPWVTDSVILDDEAFKWLFLQYIVGGQCGWRVVAYVPTRAMAKWGYAPKRGLGLLLVGHKRAALAWKDGHVACASSEIDMR